MAHSDKPRQDLTEDSEYILPAIPTMESEFLKWPPIWMDPHQKEFLQKISEILILPMSTTKQRFEISKQIDDLQFLIDKLEETIEEPEGSPILLKNILGIRNAIPMLADMLRGCNAPNETEFHDTTTIKNAIIILHAHVVRLRQPEAEGYIDMDKDRNENPNHPTHCIAAGLKLYTNEAVANSLDDFPEPDELLDTDLEIIIEKHQPALVKLWQTIHCHCPECFPERDSDGSSKSSKVIGARLGRLALSMFKTAIDAIGKGDGMYDRPTPGAKSTPRYQP
ncbi:hypothetical protein N7495_008548 [Penicillium taxi]|uniref:uncharacterized protein n=1 Tax=Penicillium taxi TaxID=168475 RepID=UPI002545B60D|nr:uncharacterized protein N7495_008548 [Penicillium taxi]KAJ5888507.1 hypothetical protein N7495_008548 [Penicillium taxi]